MNEHPKPSDWQGWVAEHGPKLLLFARQQSRTETDAQDLVQDAVVECWRRTAGDPPSLSLVFATIRRRAIDLARSNERRSRRELSTDPVGPAWFDTSAEDRERIGAIQAAMTQLPEIYREVVTLKIWGELTFAEIAAALELNPHTAASRYRYGLEALRKQMEEALT